MFTNTLLPRECFFTSPRFHDVRNPGSRSGGNFGSGAEFRRVGTKHRMLLEVTQL
jgi:hypothetical protein